MSNILAEIERTAINERREKALEIVYALARGDHRWRMCVPVDRETDSDCILVDALMDSKLLVGVHDHVAAELAAAREEIARLKGEEI